MNAALRKPMNREAFLRWAERQDGRYEFDGFQPVAMVGATVNHSRISLNIAFNLRLRGAACEPFGADAGIGTVGDAIRYPDALVTCTRFDGKARLIPEPVIVFEVLSASTARLDRFIKVSEYHAVGSIRRYVMVEQETSGLTVLFRERDEPWSTVSLIEGQTLSLPEIGIEIPVAELYDGVVFDDATPG